MSDENNFERTCTDVHISDFDWNKNFEKGNNHGILKGVIRGKFVYSHTYTNKKYYKTNITIRRLSGVEDVIPIVIPETIFESIDYETNGEYVEVTGRIYTYDVNEIINGEPKHHLGISFVAETLTKINYENNSDDNLIFLSGKNCKEPMIRTTPSGRRIAETFIAVARKGGKMDFIPCILWSENADFFNEKVKKGDRIKLQGRLQSREYWKSSKENPELKQRKVVYEVSISKILWHE